MFRPAIQPLVCLLVIISIGNLVSAQPILFQDPVSSRTFNSQKYSGIKGSPFLFEKWITGSVTTSEGIYQHLELKFDAYSNTLFFNKNDELYEFVDPLQSFRFYPDTTDTTRNMYFRKGLSAPGLRPDQYVQVLAEGPVSLYRSDIKLLSEMSEINAGMIKTFTNSTRYFILKDNKLQLIKMNKKELMAALKDKEEAVDSFIKANNLSFNRDQDLKKILSFYNSN